MAPKKTTNETQLAYRVPEFCRRVGIGHSTFWKHHKLGKICTIQFGRRTLVPADEVARLLKEGVGR